MRCTAGERVTTLRLWAKSMISDWHVNTETKKNTTHDWNEWKGARCIVIYILSPKNRKWNEEYSDKQTETGVVTRYFAFRLYYSLNSTRSSFIPVNCSLSILRIVSQWYSHCHVCIFWQNFPISKFNMIWFARSTRESGLNIFKTQLYCVATCLIVVRVTHFSTIKYTQRITADTHYFL